MKALFASKTLSVRFLLMALVAMTSPLFAQRVITALFEFDVPALLHALLNRCEGRTDVLPRQATRLHTSLALALVLLARGLAADRTVQVPFEYAKGVNSILVHARVNDKPALLILDTGSAHTVLRPELLGLPRERLQAPRRSSSGAGFSGDAIGQEVTLELGGRRWGKWPVAVMDLSEILSAYEGKIDGVLGLDFFQQFRVAVVDLTGKTITFR